MTAALLIATIVACSGDDIISTGPRPGPEPNSPREKWEARASDQYVVRQVVECFCPHAFISAIVSVDSDSIVGVIDEQTGHEIPANQQGMYRTIDQLFDWIDTLEESQPDQMIVEYDSILGYPTRIFVDPVLGMADEELGYRNRLLTQFD